MPILRGHYIGNADHSVSMKKFQKETSLFRIPPIYSNKHTSMEPVLRDSYLLFYKHRLVDMRNTQQSVAEPPRFRGLYLNDGGRSKFMETEPSFLTDLYISHGDRSPFMKESSTYSERHNSKSSILLYIQLGDLAINESDPFDIIFRMNVAKSKAFKRIGGTNERTNNYHNDSKIQGNSATQLALDTKRQAIRTHVNGYLSKMMQTPICTIQTVTQTWSPTFLKGAQQDDDSCDK